MGKYIHMELKELSKHAYKGKSFVMRYKTSGYFHIDIQDQSFGFHYQKFAAEKEMSFTDSFFGDWLEDPIGFGAFENGTLIGYVEGNLETWNNRYRISNICVFDEVHRRSGIGTKLMQKILQTAKESGARMAVLETQTCNEKAIAFYKKHGFQIIGFDLYSYTNTDPERKEVRIEMGQML